MATTPDICPPVPRRQQILDNLQTWLLTTLGCLIFFGALAYFTGALPVMIHSTIPGGPLRMGMILSLLYMVLSIPMMMGRGMEVDEYAYRRRLERAMQYFLNKETVEYDVKVLGGCVDELRAQHGSEPGVVTSRMVIDLAVKKAQGL